MAAIYGTFQKAGSSQELRPFSIKKRAFLSKNPHPLERKQNLLYTFIKEAATRRVFMNSLYKKFLFFCVLALSTFTRAETPQETILPTIHDTTPQFIAFWEAAKDLALDDQIALFEAKVVPTFPLFYKDTFENWQERGISKRDGFKKVFEAYPAVHEQFKAQSAFIAAQLKENIKTLLKTFPEFKPDFEVNLLHSFDQFDGGIRDFGTENVYFLLGADRLANDPKGTDRTPFFHHEIFHIYHCLQKHDLQNAPKKTLLWGFLWIEGLATYISEALNPGATLGDIMLGDPALECAPCMLDLWNSLSKDLESSDKETYKSYFLMASTHPTIPKKAGYYLGYLIAKELAKTYSLQELANMPFDDVYPLIIQVIEQQKTLTTISGS